MAGSVQPRAGELSHDSANGLMLDDESHASAFDRAVASGKEKPRLGGSIAFGLVIGAVAGILVGALVGVHETNSDSIQVTGTSVSQSEVP
jgi:hypothetical protein